MKKLLILFLAALVAVSSAGCFGSGTAKNKKTIDIVEPDKVNLDDYENTFDGLVNYFKKIGYILCKENGNSAATETDLNAEVINAKQGKRFQFSYNSSTSTNVTVELYELYTGENATPSDAVEQIKKNGKFDVLGIDEFEAYLSNNEKYIMIYTDTKDSDENKTRKESAIKLFKDFDRG